MRRGVLILVACLCLAGCADAAAPIGQLGVLKLPTPDALVRDAYKLFDANTGEFTETMTARAGDASVTRTTTGRFDLENFRAAMTAEFSASGPDGVALVQLSRAQQLAIGKVYSISIAQGKLKVTPSLGLER